MSIPVNKYKSSGGVGGGGSPPTMLFAEVMGAIKSLQKV